MRTYTKKEVAKLCGISPRMVENIVKNPKDNRLPDPLPMYKNPLKWLADAIDELT